MPNVNSSGTQTCVVGTSHTLATVTAALALHLAVTIPAAATPADVFEFWIEDKIAGSGDTARASAVIAVRGRGVAFNIRPLDPLLSPISAAFVLRQSAGTGRDIAWAVQAA